MISSVVRQFSMAIGGATSASLGINRFAPLARLGLMILALIKHSRKAWERFRSRLSEPEFEQLTALAKRLRRGPQSLTPTERWEFIVLVCKGLGLEPPSSGEAANAVPAT